MKIGIDAGPMLGRGGVTGYVRPLLMTLLATDPTLDYHLFLRRGWLDHDGAGDLQRIAPVHRIRIPDRFLFFWWDRPGWRLLVGRGIWSELDGYLATCLVAPALERGRVVSIIYDLIPLRLPHLFPRHREFRRQIERLVRRSAALVAISHRTRNDLVELMGVDPRFVHVVYPGRTERLGCEAERQVGRVAQRYGIAGPYILYVGSLAPHKNVSMLLRAYEEAKIEGRIEAQLVLVGDRCWGSETLRERQALKVRDDVIVTGYVSDEDLAALYAGAAVFVFPSLYEGFGLPVLDAMTAGVPVIVSKSGALPEVVGDAGCCVDAHDPHAWATAMSEILTDSKRRDSLAAMGRTRSAAFSWKNSAQQLSALLRAVCSRDAPVAEGEATALSCSNR